MKYVEIIGYKRANLGKIASKTLRREALVPAVLYGSGEQVHFAIPAILFKPLVYTRDAHFVHLNIENEKYSAILQDIQYHPVSDAIIHADFLILQENKKIKMNIPVHFVGISIGVSNGGTLMQNRHALKVKALPKNMPEFVEVDVTELDFHRAIKVSEISIPDAEIMDTPQASIAVVEVPRALRGKEAGEEEGEGEEGEEVTEETTETKE